MKKNFEEGACTVRIHVSCIHLKMGENGRGGNWRNSFYGGIPSEAGRLNRLQILNMSYNSLEGEIPVNLSHCSNLKNLDLQYNRLVQQIPSELGSLSKLEILSLANNQLSGRTELIFPGVFPPSLYNLSLLTYIALTGNNFSGNLKPDLGIALPNLQILWIGGNQFTGTIPASLSNASDFQELDIPSNNFTGTIPISFGNLQNLQWLGASYNQLGGTIPDLSNLKGIQYLDLSHNNLSGQIPSYMVNFPVLKILNLSFNNLEGEVPIEGVFRNASAVEVEGNSALCGGIQELHLHACPIQGSKKHRKHVAFKLILAIGIPAFCLTLLSLISLYRLRKSKKRCLPVSSFGRLYHKISYEELLNVTDGFSLRNLIGSGNFGSVYKGKLGPVETTVAVKVLNLQKQGASKSFVAECEALKEHPTSKPR
uniref:Protein kinase domain-containing protein n=1 Tax=Fagus sylvatica TaxID=28930 RepID=A0A2N9ETA7_FAGSY